MNLTQYLIFEICQECPLGEKHKWCPNTHPDRWKNSAGRRPLTDAQILTIAHEARCVYGFEGLIGFHYYNEPLAAWPRVKRLMEQIKTDMPQQGFTLWTNGVCLPANVHELAGFAQVNLTNYNGVNCAMLQRVSKKFYQRPVRPDNRIDTPRAPGTGPCRRMFVEMIIDYFGNVHPCCYDWRGEVPIGNVHDLPFRDIVQRWHEVRDSISGPGMVEAAPEACRNCGLRTESIGDMVPEIAGLAREYIALGAAPAKPKPTAGAAYTPPGDTPLPAPLPYVVVVAYRIPGHRVRDFCRWNDETFRRHGVRVVIVCETDYTGLPEYVLQLRFTEAMKIFSISRCKNAGIRLALAAGADPLIVSDIDLVLPETAMEKMLAVAPGEMAVPLYYMVDSYETRGNGRHVLAPLATGTLAMRAEGWRKIKYEEGCRGYGMDDGIILQDACHAGQKLTHRNEPVYHIAHQPGTPQKENRGRADHWGRKEGFNPPNFAHNQKFLR